jgi:ABC-type lipoprotein export system ATPase subunit
MNELLVQGNGLVKSYMVGATRNDAETQATFQVHGGDRIVITGASGSGKSTLLHLMSGIDSPTEGSIEWPALGPREFLRPTRVALSFQGPSLLPALSVAENVVLPLLLAGQAEATAADAAVAMLERVGLCGLAERLPEELSGGQSQRAALARALVVRPRLLLADEPTGQQDAGHALALIDLLLTVADDTGMAVVAATHDLMVAGRFRARWSMSDGTLETRVD